MTTTFPYTPQVDPVGTVAYRVRSARFGDGYSQSVADGINNRVTTWPLTFLVSDVDAAGIIAFFDGLQGYQSFYWTPPSDVQSLFQCTGFQHTPHGAGWNTITATFEQVYRLPIGPVLPTYPLDVVGGVQPLFAYSIKLLRAAYAGSALRVVRPSDSVEQDIGFVGTALDSASLTTFLGGQTGRVKTWYDQSGNANDATQATAANRPTIETVAIGGSPAVLFNFADPCSMNLPAGLSTDNRATGFYSVLEFNTAAVSAASAVIELGGATTPMLLFQNPVGNGVAWIRDNPNGNNSTFTTESRPSVYTVQWAPTSSNLSQNAEIDASPAAAVATQTGGRIGQALSAGGQNGQFYAATMIGYGRILAAGDDTALNAALNTVFGITQNPTGRVIFDGDSITAASAPIGSYPTGVNWYGYAKQASRLLSKAQHIYTCASGGSQIQTRLTTYSTEAGKILGQYTDNRVVLIMIGTNDITVGARTAAQVYADIQTYCGNVRTSGGKVIVGTILPNNANTGAQQTTQLSVNTSIRTNWATFADGLADFANDATMGPQSAAANSTLYADGLHPTRLGHSYLATIAKNAINLLI